MLFVTAARVEALKAMMVAVSRELTDSSGHRVKVEPDSDQVEAAALQCLSMMAALAYGRHEVVWPDDMIAMTPNGALFMPPNQKQQS